MHEEKCIEWGRIQICIDDVIEVGVQRKTVRGRVVDIDLERFMIVVENGGRKTTFRLLKVAYVTKL